MEIFSVPYKFLFRHLLQSVFTRQAELSVNVKETPKENLPLAPAKWQPKIAKKTSATLDIENDFPSLAPTPAKL